MEAEFRLSQMTIDRIGEEDAARLRDLHDAGWHVEEQDLSGRVIAEWEDLGVFVARERSDLWPQAWSAWLHDEDTATGADTLDGALTALAVDLRATAEEITAFVGGAR